MNPDVQLLCGEPHEDEQAHHIVACNDYLRLGRGRSLSKLRKHYQKILDDAHRLQLPAPNVPTTDKSGNVIAGWSSKFGWVKRAHAYDMMQEEKKNMQAEQILNSGFALPHQRVALLDELTRKVLSELDKRGMYGVRKKALGLGEDFQIINEEVFRKDEVRELRGLLDDLAQETGGRVSRNNMNATGLAGILSGATNFNETNVEDAEWEPIEEETPKSKRKKEQDDNEAVIKRRPPSEDSP